MSNKRTVITRTRRSKQEEKGFLFTKEMIPESEGEMRKFRQDAWDIYQRLPMPTTRDEAWRRTDLRSLPGSSFHMLNGKDEQIPQFAKAPADLFSPLVGDIHGGQILISPSRTNVELDPELVSKGVIFTDLRNAEKEHSALLGKLVGQVVRPEEGKFAALAGALSQNGILLYVPRGVHVEQPLHSVIWGPGSELAYISHIIVWLEEGASATYVHESTSPTESSGHSMHVGLVEIKVADRANLRFVELQSWGDHVWNFSHERVQVERDAQIDWVFGAIGSHLTKNFSDLDLMGRGASGRMSGFYFTDGVQHFDHDTQQNHMAPDTTSDLLFKGALRDNSRSVWQGMIYVAPGAQKTDGYQANRNLVLSPEARADSIPGLEIMADDVRCTHGATVGKIDPDQVFYLRSRGIPYDEAERLIVEGFFDPIMQRIPFDGVRNRFQTAIHEKMG